MQAFNYTTARNSLKPITNTRDEYNCTYAKLKRELHEAMDQFERGKYMGIDEAFDNVIAKYAD